MMDLTAALPQHLRRCETDTIRKELVGDKVPIAAGGVVPDEKAKPIVPPGHRAPGHPGGPRKSVTRTHHLTI